MKRDAIVALVVACGCGVATLAASLGIQPQPSGFPDTETRVAFGHDENCDGVLQSAESALAVGWDAVRGLPAADEAISVFASRIGLAVKVR